MAGTVLIVEDEFLIRLMLAEALTDEGFDVREAASSEEAVDMLRAEPAIGLLLTDINIPGTHDGHAVARIARDRNPSLPVIYMTGQPDSRGQAPSERDVYIAKPYLPSDVCAAARRLTEQPPG